MPTPRGGPALEPQAGGVARLDALLARHGFRVEDAIVRAGLRGILIAVDGRARFTSAAFTPQPERRPSAAALDRWNAALAGGLRWNGFRRLILTPAQRARLERYVGDDSDL